MGTGGKSLGTKNLDRNKLTNWVVREKSRARKTITPIRLGIKGRGPDTTVDQSPTEKTTVNNTLSGTILKSRKMTNSQLPAQPSSATMDGKNSSFLKNKTYNRKDRRERSLQILPRGESLTLPEIFVRPNKRHFFLFKTHLWRDVFSAKNRDPSRTTKNRKHHFNSIQFFFDRTTVPGMEWTQEQTPRDKESWPEQINELSGVREIARTKKQLHQSCWV